MYACNLLDVDRCSSLIGLIKTLLSTPRIRAPEVRALEFLV